MALHRYLSRDCGPYCAAPFGDAQPLLVRPILAGLANFLPRRATNHVFFPGNPTHGFVVIGFGVTALVTYTIRQKSCLIKSV